MNYKMTFATLLAASAIHAETLASGLEFHAPQGWTVEVKADAAILAPPDWVMEPNAKDPSELYLVAVLPGVRSLQDPALASTLQRFTNNAQVRTAYAPQAFHARSGAGALYTYDAVSDAVALRVESYVVALPNSTVAAVVAIGRPSLVERRRQLLASVIHSLSVGTPVSTPTAQSSVPTATTSLSASWEQRLRGKKLYRFSSYSSSYGSGGMNSQTTLLLGTNGVYEYRHAGSVSVYVPGATGGSASKNQAQGQWRIYEQSGKAILELRSSTGGVENIVLSKDGTKTLLNGQRWLVGD